MADQEITATFHGATRALNSPNGNPTWILHTSEGDFRTGADASIGYDIDNHTNSRDDADDWVGKSVVFTLTGRAKRVSYWRRAE